MDKKILESAIEKYGREKQLDMVIEEMAELTKAICKYKRIDEYYLPEDIRDNLIEETADVKIMIAQLEMIFSFGDEVGEKIEEKMDRLQRRLENV